MKSLENNGLIMLNFNNQLVLGENTIVVVGLPRSGTSMIGKVLYELNVFHDNGFLNKNIYEDMEAIEVLEKDINKLDSYIKNQNSKYTIWGFKRPGAFYYIEKYIDKLRNPIYIIPMKDMLFISLRKNISIDMDFTSALKETLKQSNELIEFINKTSVPTILFSYEKAILNPEYFVKELIKILSLNNISKYRINRAIEAITINPKEYLNSSRIHINGKVENLHNGILLGWAKTDVDDRVVDIKVYDLLGNLIVTSKACIYREDLRQNNIGNGKHAFEIKIPSNLGINDIVVTAGKHNDKLSINTGIN